MERLTKRIDGGIERVCHHYPEEEKMCYGCVKRTACNAAIFDRLAYYEDMEEQGRLVVLPCKLGDTVYMLSTECEICETYIDEPQKCKDCQKGSYVCEVAFDYWLIPVFGKTVFLTREEAEQALKGGAE